MSDKILIKSTDDSVNQKNINKIKQENKKLADELSAFTPAIQKENKMDPEILKNLKSKLETKVEDHKEEPMPDIIATQDVSIQMAIIGVGQAGSRIAEVFYALGYDVGVINTSAQDLKFINVLDTNKLLLDGTLGGTGKDLDLGREIFSSHKDEIIDFVSPIINGNDMIYLAVSGGGGTGSSSVDVMIPLLLQSGLPIGVIYVLPKATDDAQSKKNSIETIARLAKMTSEDMVSSLVVVDNARIEQIYGGLGQAQFWSKSNQAIVEPIHIFNHLTSQASNYTSLDPSDFGKIISCGDCSIYGVVEVENYMQETALAEAVIHSLSGNMLAEGFDISQTRVGGVIVVASDAVLDKLPAINIDYAFHMISEQTSGANIFRGIYSDNDAGDTVKIYSWFAGLGLPQDRIVNLQKESQAQSEVEAAKNKSRSSNMNLELTQDKVNSVADQIHRKIEKKNSGFNKLQGPGQKSIIDMRKNRR